MLKKIILSLLVSSAGYSQIKYVPVMVNQCTGNPEYEYFQIINCKGEIYSNNINNDTITIPEPGVYKMYYGLNKMRIQLNLVMQK